MLYFSKTRLMLESEHAISDNAANGPVAARRVCTQLLSDSLRYRLWLVRHEHSMNAVSSVRSRQRQVLMLRALALENIHDSALIQYLRGFGVVGEARDRTLRHFFGGVGSRDAALVAHRNYVSAASSHLCAVELLDLANDVRGLELLTEYEQTYGQLFGIFCESSRAKQPDASCESSPLLAEARAAAADLRRRILEGDGRRKPRAHVANLPLGRRATRVQRPVPTGLRLLGGTSS